MTPHITGEWRAWDYLYEPKFDLDTPRKWVRLSSYAPLYRRPKIRPKSEYTYYVSGTLPITVTKANAIDGFTLPFSAQLASLFTLNMVMHEILWVAGLHDKLCREKIGDAPWRAYVFREAIWYATEVLLPRNEKHWSWFDRMTRRVRASVLSTGVWLGMKFGAC